MAISDVTKQMLHLFRFAKQTIFLGYMRHKIFLHFTVLFLTRNFIYRKTNQKAPFSILERTF
jgi:hypothetical protein